MSRIGKKAVTVPTGVTANVEGQTVKVKGPKGALQLVLHDDLIAKMDKGGIQIDPRSETKRARSQWGTYRTLEITGVGYRATAQGKNLKLQLGYSHDVNVDVPEGIEVKTPDNTTVEVSGIDRQKVGQVAAEIRDFRSPEPYKGKGVKYVGEYIFRKEGKKK